MRTEQDLTKAYRDLAADAPQADTVLAAIEQAERTKPKRGILMISAVAATATAAVAIAAPILLQNEQALPASGADRAANPAWRTAFTTDLPTGFTADHQYVTTTFHRTTASGPPTALCDITAYRAGLFDPKRIPAGSPRISINGKPGHLATMTDPGSSAPETLPRAVWQYDANSWAVVGCSGGGDLVAIAKTIAGGLTFKPGRIDAPLKVGYWPASAPVDSLTPLTKKPAGSSGPAPAFGISGEARGDGTSRVKHGAQLSYTPGPAETREGTPVTVQGLKATLVEAPGLSTLYIEGDGFEVAIHLSTAGFADPRGELTRIGEGLDLSANPTDPGTWFDATRAIP
ncbi:hypothetical protein [Kribbella deserti]|uniref:Uncharacterized protein n=1 Tax=Kribbella deserti TaxID=1926257 RepID=A0ABV6QK53_9ACTN